MINRDMEIVLKLYKFDKKIINLAAQEALPVYKENQN